MSAPLGARPCPLCGAQLAEGGWLAVLEAHFAACPATEAFAPHPKEKAP